MLRNDEVLQVRTNSGAMWLPQTRTNEGANDNATGLRLRLAKIEQGV